MSGELLRSAAHPTRLAAARRGFARRGFARRGLALLGTALLGTALLGAGLLGCTSSSEPEGVTTIGFVTWKPTQPAVWDALVEEFHEANPTIRVRRQIGPHSSTAFHDLLTQKLKNGDTTVDVFFLDVVWAAELAAAGWTLPLDDRFPESERRAFLPGALEASRWEGRVHGVPAFVDFGLLYYRKDLLDAAELPVPGTWDELAAAARIATAGEGREGMVGYAPQLEQYEGLVCNALELVASAGGQLVDPTGTRAGIAEPPALEAIRWLRARLADGLVARSSLTHQEPESLATFVQGDAVFHRNWPYAWEVANDPARSRVVGRVGVAPLPHFAGGVSSPALGGWQLGVHARSTKVAAAWRFVAFLTSEAAQKRLAVEASLLPARFALHDDPEVLGRNPWLAGLAGALGGVVPRPVTPLYPAVSDVLQRYLSTAIADSDRELESLARTHAAEIDRLLELGARARRAGT